MGPAFLWVLCGVLLHESHGKKTAQGYLCGSKACTLGYNCYCKCMGGEGTIHTFNCDACRNTTCTNYLNDICARGVIFNECRQNCLMEENMVADGNCHNVSSTTAPLSYRLNCLPDGSFQGSMSKTCENSSTQEYFFGQSKTTCYHLNHYDVSLLIDCAHGFSDGEIVGIVIAVLCVLVVGYLCCFKRELLGKRLRKSPRGGMPVMFSPHLQVGMTLQQPKLQRTQQDAKQPASGQEAGPLDYRIQNEHPSFRRSQAGANPAQPADTDYRIHSENPSLRRTSPNQIPAIPAETTVPPDLLPAAYNPEFIPVSRASQESTPSVSARGGSRRASA